MRTFEFNDGKSNKFWQIELAGKSFTVTFGRAGTGGQTQTKSFPTPDKAKAAHDKLIGEKLAKGYVEKSAGKAPASPSSGKALENAVFANPDDLGAHAAYADWLSEQGDPRGEFIQVQLALEDEKLPAKKRKELEKREQELLKKHHKEWAGGLAPFFKPEDQRCKWARGWIDSLSISSLNVALSRALASAPLARCLRRLEIRRLAYELASAFEGSEDVPAYAEEPALHPLLGSKNLLNLRVFQLGDPDEVHAALGGFIAVDLIKQMPRIELLYLMANALEAKDLFRLKTLQNLRVLRLDHLTEYPFAFLARNAAFGQLTTLLCHPHALREDDEAAYIGLHGVKAIVRSPHLENLRHLKLWLCDMGDKGCQEIVASGILKRLEVLDLFGGLITDAGAKILAGCKDLRKLELLDVGNNRLTKAGIKTLEATGVKVRAHAQRDPNDEDNDYLCEGDWE